MRVQIKISNSQLYQKLVDKVDCSQLTEMEMDVDGIFEVFDGSIQIYTRDGKVHPFYGFIEADSFESDYGFTIQVLE